MSEVLLGVLQGIAHRQEEIISETSKLVQETTKLVRRLEHGPESTWGQVDDGEDNDTSIQIGRRVDED